jgi:hypothetical protein
MFRTSVPRWGLSALDRDIQESKQRNGPTDGQEKNTQDCNIDPEFGRRTAGGYFSWWIEPLGDPVFELFVVLEPTALAQFDQSVFDREFEHAELELSTGPGLQSHGLEAPDLSPESVFGFVLKVVGAEVFDA